MSSQIPLSIIWWCCYKRSILGDVVCWWIMIMTWAGGVLVYVGVDILVLGVVVVDFYFAFLEVVWGGVFRCPQFWTRTRYCYYDYGDVCLLVVYWLLLWWLWWGYWLHYHNFMMVHNFSTHDRISVCWSDWLLESCFSWAIKMLGMSKCSAYWAKYKDISANDLQQKNCVDSWNVIIAPFWAGWCVF